MHSRFLYASATICILASLGCGDQGSKEAGSSSTDGEDAVPYVQYLQGTFQTTSPDGGVTYEEVDVLAEKIIDSAAGTIVEYTLHGDEVRTTFFTLQPGTRIFDVTDEENTFSGTMTFETDDWATSDVTYDLEIFGQYPGTMTGSGVWEADTYITDKLFANPAGTVEARTTEVLTIIGEDEYSAALPE